MNLDKLNKEIDEISDDNAREEAKKRLLAIAKVYSGEDEVLSWAEILSSYNADRETFDTGLPQLNELLKGGFRPRQVIAISALTGSGKTSFLVDLSARNEDKKPFWISLEEAVEDLMEKFEERGEGTIPDFYSPKSNKLYDINWIEEKIVEAIAKYGSRWIFIDHLGYIVPKQQERNDLLVEYAMQRLKTAAKRWQVTIFLAVHVTKTKMVEQPTMDDIKGSSAIGQEADTAMLLWRETKREDKQIVINNNVNLSVQKARRGKPGNIKLVFRGGKYYEEDWTQSEADREFKNKW
jgi:replicative DNA helicase